MYTMKQWNKDGGDFTSHVKDGQEVSLSIVEYFRDVLPPYTKNNKFVEIIQCSEPLTTNKHGFIYITFIKQKKKIIDGDKGKLNVWKFYKANKIK